MTLTRHNIDSVAVLDIDGRLTSLDGAGLLKAAVDGLVREGQLHIVLNLAKLTYMDSSGLGEMIACYSSVFKIGGAVKLANTTSRVHDLLTITKLITVFETFDTEQLAVESFATSAPVAGPVLPPPVGVVTAPTVVVPTTVGRTH
jgi:anti-sigma B factor antagonist